MPTLPKCAGSASKQKNKTRRLSRAVGRKDTSSKPVSTASSLVLPQPCDVLLGRGKGSYESQGNREYARIIASYVPVYELATNNKDKIRITEEIVGLVKSSGARFLKHVAVRQARKPRISRNIIRQSNGSATNTTISNEDWCCMIISDAEARRKVSQVGYCTNSVPPFEDHFQKHQYIAVSLCIGLGGYRRSHCVLFPMGAQALRHKRLSFPFEESNDLQQLAANSSGVVSMAIPSAEGMVHAAKKAKREGCKQHQRQKKRVHGGESASNDEQARPSNEENHRGKVGKRHHNNARRKQKTAQSSAEGKIIKTIENEVPERRAAPPRMLKEEKFFLDKEKEVGKLCGSHQSLLSPSVTISPSAVIEQKDEELLQLRIELPKAMEYYSKVDSDDISEFSLVEISDEEDFHVGE
ncbi:hypothetical protein ACA910_002259 [Epithemia clementina (nom. ined.)]